MHEKRARDKEKRLLEQEKQLYQARIRSHIRAKIVGKQEEASSASHGPMSPEDHIKALANRFIKEGAEDLWNKNDGPLKSPPLSRKELPRSSGRSGSIGSPLDLRKLIPERHNMVSNRESVNYTNTTSNYAQTRNYSVQSQRRFQRNESSSDEEDSNSVLKENSARPVIRNFVSNTRSVNNKNVDDYVNNKKMSPRSRRKFWRDESSSSDNDSDLDSSGEPANYLRGRSLSLAGKGISNETEDLRTVRDVNRMGSSASLGKYDMKTKRRVLPTLYDEERDLSEQVELIRYELNKRKLSENDEQKGEEETVLSKRR